jgi:hypothetical protein
MHCRSPAPRGRTCGAMGLDAWEHPRTGWLLHGAHQAPHRVRCMPHDARTMSHAAGLGGWGGWVACWWLGFAAKVVGQPCAMGGDGGELAVQRKVGWGSSKLEGRVGGEGLASRQFGLCTARALFHSLCSLSLPWQPLLCRFGIEIKWRHESPSQLCHSSLPPRWFCWKGNRLKLKSTRAGLSVRPCLLQRSLKTSSARARESPPMPRRPRGTVENHVGWELVFWRLDGDEDPCQSRATKIA